MISSIINSIGLMFDVIGALVICFYGFPQQSYEEISENSMPLLGDIRVPGAKEHNELMRKRKASHVMLARIALIFMIIGFVFQLASDWIWF